MNANIINLKSALLHLLSSRRNVELLSYKYTDDDGQSERIDNVLSIFDGELWFNFYTLSCNTRWSLSNHSLSSHSDLHFLYDSEIDRFKFDEFESKDILGIEFAYMADEMGEIRGLNFERGSGISTQLIFTDTEAHFHTQVLDVQLKDSVLETMRHLNEADLASEVVSLN